MSLYLEALAADERGDWEKAHALVQDEPGADAARIHAYLHRKEGDEWNAGYWYRRAGLTPFQGPLEAEWQELWAYFSGK